MAIAISYSRADSASVPVCLEWHLNGFKWAIQAYWAESARASALIS